MTETKTEARNNADKAVKGGYSRIVYLHFSPETSTKPVVCDLVRDFDLTFNILKANILPRREGRMILEISGSEKNYKKGVEYLRTQGITTVPVAQKTSRDEESCVHCGICTALCIANALHLNLETRKVEFDREKCTGCGLCTRVCPVKAMHVDLEEGF
jgi:ferredoxin